MPMECAKEIAATFCWKIRYALIPVFGSDFPMRCISPGQPEFSSFRASPAAIERCRIQDKALRRGFKEKQGIEKSLDDSSHRPPKSGEKSGSKECAQQTIPRTPSAASSEDNLTIRDSRAAGSSKSQWHLLEPPGSNIIQSQSGQSRDQAPRSMFGIMDSMIQTRPELLPPFVLQQSRYPQVFGKGTPDNHSRYAPSNSPQTQSALSSYYPSPRYHTASEQPSPNFTSFATIACCGHFDCHTGCQAEELRAMGREAVSFLPPRIVQHRRAQPETQWPTRSDDIDAARALQSLSTDKAFQKRRLPTVRSRDLGSVAFGEGQASSSRQLPVPTAAFTVHNPLPSGHTADRAVLEPSHNPMDLNRLMGNEPQPGIQGLPAVISTLKSANVDHVNNNQFRRKFSLKRSVDLCLGIESTDTKTNAKKPRIVYRAQSASPRLNTAKWSLKSKAGSLGKST
jgi:hypothetical protein